MERYGLGLRTQILVALSLAFAVSFTLLGVVVVRLVQRDAQLEGQRRAEATARSLAAGLDAGRGPASAADLSRLVGQQGIRGLRLRPAADAEAGAARFGDVSGRPRAEAPLAEGGTLELWLEPPDPARTAPLGNLLRLYLFVTGATILLVGYVLLTRLIVRPVEELTRASERLARGAGSGHVPVRGAAEVVRLGVSFNRMGVELAQEREALRARLAELERTTSELRAAQDHLIRSEKLASVGRLAAGVAHEIGNPLSAILGFVELLRGGDLDDATREEFLDRVQRETERIHHIIRDLLDYSRSEVDAEESSAKSDLVEAVEDAVKLVAPQKDLRGVSIEQRKPAGPVWVRAPAHSLTQVVLNLLLNAADAVAGEGEILIEIEPRGDEVCLGVTDSGPGVAPEVLSTLFDPFVTTKPAGAGTGLGLSVCQSIVERFEGRIRAENAVQGGARFSVWLKSA